MNEIQEVVHDLNLLQTNKIQTKKNITYQITCKLPFEQYSLTKQSGSRHAPINRTRYSLCISLILILQKQQLKKYAQRKLHLQF